MKKIFTLAAFLFVVAISSSALAANWVYVSTNYYESQSIKHYVDKDSIKRATNSKFSQPNAVLAVVKQVSEKESLDEDGAAAIMGFWTNEKNGKKYFAYLTDYLNGSSSFYNGMVADDAWEMVWDYVYNNLP